MEYETALSQRAGLFPPLFIPAVMTTHVHGHVRPSGVSGLVSIMGTFWQKHYAMFVLQNWEPPGECGMVGISTEYIVHVITTYMLLAPAVTHKLKSTLTYCNCCCLK